MKGRTDNGIYVIYNAETKSLDHERFGHIGMNKMRLLDFKPRAGLCKSCIIGEHSKQPYYSGETDIKTSQDLELVHMDLVGLI